ncbi:MAG: dTMP kinase [Candidatus Saccharimonadales bacterium]
MRGKYIVIEGAQGVGKTTIIQRLGDMLAQAGLAVKVMREPESQNDLTSRTIRHLTQDPRYPMSTRTEVLLYNAARSQSLEIIRDAVKNGVYVLVDRSYLTTLAIQYYGRGDVQDYQKINEIIEFAVGDMQPDLLLVLDAPVDVLKKRTQARYNGDRFDNLDEAFLERVRAGYLWEAKQRNLPVIYATGDKDEVFKEVWQVVVQTIEKRGNPAARPVPVADVIAQKSQPGVSTLNAEALATGARTAPSSQTAEPWLAKDDAGKTVITEAGYATLKPLVTSTKSNVYALTNNISPITTAAAMARLSRRADDLRITLLDEFIGKVDKDGQLLQRVITAYGDDSVQQLMGQHIVVENASNLLTKKLEWGRLAAYLEQSTRYIYFDEKDTQGRYKYFVPDELTGALRAEYVHALDTIFDIYSELVAKLTDYVRSNSTVPKAEQDAAWRAATKAQACDAIRPLLPVATRSTVGIFASGQALEGLVMHLLADELKEAQVVGKAILEEARKVVPAILERADKPERGGATIAYMAETKQQVRTLAERYLVSSYAGAAEPVTLVSFTPRNELDIVADMLYEHSSTPLNELRREVATWSYDKRAEVFAAYMGDRLNRRQRPGRALENIHYTFDLVCDYGIFRDLQRHRMVDDLEWQELTPRYGYETPKLVEEAGMADVYDKCFDISLALHSKLVAEGLGRVAQYATLLGHKMRWKVTMNAREAMHFNELRTAPQGHPGYRKLVGQMHDKLCEVHPLLGQAIKFVNQDENPELTRLAAERYTQFKLQQLESDNKKK